METETFLTSHFGQYLIVTMRSKKFDVICVNAFDDSADFYYIRPEDGELLGGPFSVPYTDIVDIHLGWPDGPPSQS